MTHQSHNNTHSIMNKQVSLKWFQHCDWELNLINSFIDNNIQKCEYSSFDVYDIAINVKGTDTTYYQYQIFCKCGINKVTDVINVTIIRKIINGKFVYAIKKSRNQPKVKSFLEL